MLPLSLSYGSSSGVSGDTRSGPLGDLYFATPFAVGSAASAGTEQTGGAAAKPNWVMIAVGVGLAVVIFLVAVIHRRP